MKKIVLLIFTLILSFNSFSQVLNERFEGGTFPPTTLGNWTVFQNAPLNISLVCGDNFVDAGGTTGNYPNDSNFASSTVTIYPDNPGEKVTVTFSSFDTESNYDGLYVFDGNSTAAPQIASTSPAGSVPAGLAGSYWGTTLPGPFTSASADGSLTFAFSSDNGVTKTGWVSTITCAAPPTCVNPTTLNTTAIGTTSVTLGWTQPLNPDGSQATAWETLALTCGSPAPTAFSTGWVAAPTNPFEISGLASGVCYDFYVRAVCSVTDSSSWSNSITATTIPSCGGLFVDAGGMIGDYPNNSNFANATITIYPTVPGELVTVTFTSFDTEEEWDGLYVFDGNSTAAPQIPSSNPAGNVPGGLAGSYWGTTLPGPFTSSSADGSLTFAFISDGAVNNPGWVADVTCGPPATCAKPKLLTANNITQTSVSLGWTQPLNPDSSQATAWQVLVLPCGSPSPSDTTTGWTATSSNPFVYSGLTAASCYDYYIRAVCSASDSSNWSVPKSFYTSIVNDECLGSVFVPVNQNTNCLQSVSGTITGATASAEPNSCGATDDDDDVWFHFVATDPTHYISLLDATNFLNYALYSGTNCGSLTQVGTCITESGGVANALVVGQTYYVRVYSPGTSETTITFKICIGTNSGTCPTALPLCAINPIIFPNNVGVPSPSGSTGCLAASPSPTYYYLQIPANGNYAFFIEQNTNNTFTGAGLDVDFVSWGPYVSNAVACSTISQSNTLPAPNGCSFSSATTETFTINGAITGEVYVLMITNYTAETLPGQTGFIKITQTIGPVPTICCPYTNFSYSATFFCKDATNPSPILASGATAGTYSCSNPALIIDPITGTINLSLSTVGTYTITNAIQASGTCPASTSTWSITISPVPNATITYSAASYCNGNNTIQTVSQTGTAGGSYSVTPVVGLPVDTATGAFNPSTGTSGTYTVTYTIVTAGGCPVFTASTTVAITPFPIATFSYDSVTYCQNGANPIISYSGGGMAGVFTSSPGLSLDANTGAINLALSLPGNYIVTNTIVGCATVSSIFDINIFPDIAIEIKEKCLGSKLILTASPISGSFDPLTATYEWFGPNGFTSGPSNLSTVEIQGLAIGVYTVTVTSNGCTSSQNITVDNTTCIIQKGISPNGDANNQSFILSDVKQINIFNRYGTKVFSYANYTDQWHGQSDKGEELPDGTYYYVFERNSGETKTGWIYINR